MSLWDVVAVCCILFSWDFLMRFDAFCSAIVVWEFLLKFYLFSAAQFFCKIFLVGVAFCWTVMRFPYWDLCFLAVMKCHEVSSWGFMLLGRYAISLWLCVAFSWIIVRWDLMFLFFVVMRVRAEISCCCGPYEITWWDQMVFAAEFSHEEICVREVLVSCRCEMSLWNLSRLAAYFTDEISWRDVILVGRYELSWLDSMLFAAHCSYEISWWDGMLFWAVTSFAYEISQCLFVRYANILMRLHAFWLPNILFDGVM
jgi:hypothetical protein